MSNSTKRTNSDSYAAAAQPDFDADAAKQHASYSYAEAAKQPATKRPTRECTRNECWGHTSVDSDIWQPKHEHLSRFWNLHRDCPASIWFWSGTLHELINDPHYAAMIAAGRIMV